MFKKMGYVFVNYYKNNINPLMASRCIYTPSCSAYMLQAISKHGFFVGFAQGIARICRCNPFAKGGFDPVKDFYRGKYKWIL